MDTYYNYNREYNVSASYEITILNDTNYPSDIIWTGWFCGGIGTGRPVGQCTNPVKLLPGQTVSHRFRYTQYEGVLISNEGLWCAFPLNSELSKSVISLSEMLKIIKEESAKGNKLCSKEMPTSWYGTILGAMAAIATSTVAMAVIIFKLSSSLYSPKMNIDKISAFSLSITNRSNIGNDMVETTALSVLGFGDDYCATGGEISRAYFYSLTNYAGRRELLEVIRRAYNLLENFYLDDNSSSCIKNFPV